MTAKQPSVSPAEFRARLALHVLTTTEDTRDAAAALRPIPAVCQHPGRAGAICFACTTEARR